MNNSSVNRSTVSSASATSALVSVLLLASGLGAQSFSFPSFASVGNLTMNGTAGQVGSVLRVTDLGAGDVGAAWYSTPVSVAEGFETEFLFRMSSAPDGMAFVIQGSPAGASAMVAICGALATASATSAWALPTASRSRSMQCRMAS